MKRVTKLFKTHFRYSQSNHKGVLEALKELLQNII